MYFLACFFLMVSQAHAENGLPKWQQCSQEKECTVIKGCCNWEPVNRAFENDYADAQKAQCPKLECGFAGDPKVRPEVSCVKNLCVTEFSPEQDPDTKTCSKETPQWCSALSSRFRGRNPEKTYALVKQGCDYDEPQACSSLYNDARALGAQKQEEAKAYLIKKCAKNDRFCNDVARIYYDEKNVKQGLEIDRKYFAKYHEGSFPYETFKAGNKTEGYQAAAQACEHEPEHCVFYIRYLPANPEIKSLLARAEKRCQENAGKSSGATDCSILGTYYYVYGDHKKALELWSTECKLNVTIPCQLTMGSDATESEKALAFKHFCSSNPLDGLAQAQRKEGCLAQADKMNAAILQSSVETLNSFVKEQAKP